MERGSLNCCPLRQTCWITDIKTRIYSRWKTNWNCGVFTKLTEINPTTVEYLSVESGLWLFLMWHVLFQWLVKRAIETREEMGDYVRAYSISQFQKSHTFPEVTPPVLNRCRILPDCDVCMTVWTYSLPEVVSEWDFLLIFYKLLLPIIITWTYKFSYLCIQYEWALIFVTAYS